jgi:hypothetical protein
LVSGPDELNNASATLRPRVLGKSNPLRRPPECAGEGRERLLRRLRGGWQPGDTLVNDDVSRPSWPFGKGNLRLTPGSCVLWSLG